MSQNKKLDQKKLQTNKKSHLKQQLLKKKES